VDYAKTVKALKDEFLVSQSELVDLLGISYASVNRWENEHRAPTIRTKRKIRSLCQKHNIEVE
jgi:putative transcriptional regulator